MAEALAPVLDLTDLGQVSEPIEAELTRRDALTPRTQEVSTAHHRSRCPGRSVHTRLPLGLTNRRRCDEVEQVRAAIRRLPLPRRGCWLQPSAVNALLILLLGSGFGSRLRGLGVALLPAAAAVGMLGHAAEYPARWLDRRCRPRSWPPADAPVSAGLAEASVALFGGSIVGIGEQLLRAAIVTFAVAVGLIAASMADLL